MNTEPITRDVSTASQWAQMRRALGLRLSRRLFEELSADPDSVQRQSGRSMSWSLGLAYAASTLVYASSLLFGVLGVALLFRPWSTIFDPAIAVVFMLLCWAARPRITDPPYYLLSRSEFPTLYTLSDRISAALKTAPPHGIGYSADFGANYRRAGWRGRPYMELGAPLMAVLSQEERVGVIAHELSHGANRDPLRSNYLAGAVNTLAGWGAGFHPGAIGSLGEGLPFGPVISLLGIPFELVMLAFSKLVFIAAQGLLLLVMRQSQRAEYLADLLAASVAGTKEMQDALEKTYLDDAISQVVRHHALTNPYAPMEDKIAKAAALIEPAVIEHLRAKSLSLEWQVDSTHPPTALRVRLLQRFSIAAKPGLLSAAEREALRAEIDRILQLSEREMINRQIEAAGA